MRTHAMNRAVLLAATAVLMVFGTAAGCNTNNPGGEGGGTGSGGQQPAISEQPGFSVTPSPTVPKPSSTP